MHISPPFIPPDSSSLTRGQKQYRIYCLDGAGHIHRSFEFHAQNDEEAIKIGNAWRDHGRAELWCRDRKVKGWD